MPGAWGVCTAREGCRGGVSLCIPGDPPNGAQSESESWHVQILDLSPCAHQRAEPATARSQVLGGEVALVSPMAAQLAAGWMLPQPCAALVRDAVP